MAKTLQFTETLALPLDAATQTFAFIGRRGSGKSYAAGKLTELFLEARIQTIVLDLVGNWNGLRVAADGKGDGFDIPILGGLRGDIPLNAQAGELVADILCDTGRSAIIDLSQFSLADRKRFATAFATRLWQRKKAELDPTPLFLFVEECHLLIPQVVKGDDARMVGIFEEIIRLGRNFGIGSGLIDQRPQSVNKEALNQTECVLAFQLNGTHERKAMRDWIVAKGLDVNLVDELPSLKVGEPYLWSPQWLNFLGKVKIARKRTFDSTATPKVGQKRVQRELKPLDLAALEERMGVLIEEKKANDPAALKQRIRELEKQLAARSGGETKVERVEVPVRVEVPILQAEAVAALQEAVRLIQEAASGTSTAAERIAGALQSAQRPVVHPGRSEAPAFHPASVSPGNRATTAVRERPAAAAVTTRADVSGPQQRILNALATFSALGLHHVDRRNAAVWADQSPRSSGFEKNISTLRTKGLIEYPAQGQLALTEVGRAAAEVSHVPASLDELQAHWQHLVSGPQGRMLEALIRVYPNALEWEELCRQSGQSPTSSGAEKNRSTLRTLGLIDYPERGTAAATALLFPEGLQ